MQRRTIGQAARASRRWRGLRDRIARRGAAGAGAEPPAAAPHGAGAARWIAFAQRGPDQARLSRPTPGRFPTGTSRARPAGYSVALCQRIADAVKAEPGLGSVTGGVGAGDGRRALPCAAAGPDRPALRRRDRDASSGAGRRRSPSRSFRAASARCVRADAPARLREVLSGRGQTVPSDLARDRRRRSCRRARFPPSTGTTSENVAGRAHQRISRSSPTCSPSSSYDAGVQAVLDRQADAFFAERAVLLDAARRHASARDLLVARSLVHVRAAGAGLRARRRGLPARSSIAR